ncbi:uncharacterized protein TNCV_2707151 [Trichonephila clavipes]|nr:uncharacterized protein TNCV_2707151 [Trichonephila clavipes]
MEPWWSARQVARQLGRSDCVLRRYWDQWIRKMSFTRRPGSEHPRQTSRREDQHIVLNARVQPTAVNPVLSRFNERNMLTNFQFCRSKPGVGIMSTGGPSRHFVVTAIT